MAIKQTEPFSMRMDKETYHMLQEIKVYRDISSDSQAVRWLIRRYHKKKIAKMQDTPKNVCHLCKHSAERTDLTRSGGVIPYCCARAHDIDDEFNSHGRREFERKD